MSEELEQEVRGMAVAQGCDLVIEQRRDGRWRAAFRQSGTDGYAAEQDTREGALSDLRDAIILDDQA
jgi:hypothetical protein